MGVNSLYCWDMLQKAMQVKPLIARSKLTDGRWLQLDDTVHSKLTNIGTSERLNHLESTIFAEAGLFGHSPKLNWNLACQRYRTILSINLIKERNLLLAQILVILPPWKKDSTWSSSFPCKVENKVSSQSWKKPQDVSYWRRLVMISNIILTRSVNLCLTPIALFLWKYTKQILTNIKLLG